MGAYLHPILVLIKETIGLVVSPNEEHRPWQLDRTTKHRREVAQMSVFCWCCHGFQIAFMSMRLEISDLENQIDLEAGTSLTVPTERDHLSHFTVDVAHEGDGFL